VAAVESETDEMMFISEEPATGTQAIPEPMPAADPAPIEASSAEEQPADIIQKLPDEAAP
jgi:hypothetical protein